jgi:type II secretory pathway pseudopilin PulG
MTCIPEGVMSENSRGVTLIELLVAIGLMVMLTGSISFVFVTARDVFTKSEATIQVYQNARNAFDVIERELSIAVKTHDMEFFMDRPESANGHFETNEECFGLKVDDPGSSSDDHAKNATDYVYAMTIYGRDYPDPKSPGRRPHRSDMIYFKSLTTVGGKTRSALILYKIDTSEPTKPILKKYVLYRSDIVGTGLAQDPPDKSGQDLCIYVTDVKIEYYFDNVLDAKQPGFFEVEVGKQKTFCYLGTSGQGSTDANGVFTTTGFDDMFADNFGQLSARDKIFLYGAPVPWQKENSQDYVIDSITTTGDLTFSKTALGVPVSVSGINFRSGYLPPALRFTLKIMDTKGMQVRTLTRIIKIQSR